MTFEDNVEYYKTDCENAELEWAFSAGYQKMSIITQNVDGLHRKAGSNSKYITELHGTHDRLVCMTCGGDRCRHDFHNELDEQNSAWIQGQLSEMNTMNSEDRSQQLRQMAMHSSKEKITMTLRSQHVQSVMMLMTMIMVMDQHQYRDFTNQT